MPTIKRRPFPGTPDDDEILRRLGAAIAIHWDMIPSEVFQTSLIFQAAIMGGDSANTAAMRERITAFIEAYRGKGAA